VDEFTRPPEKNDLVELCRELNRLGAKYIIVGGLAMLAHGLIRTTEDIDLLIEESLENQAKVKQALRILPDRSVDELGNDDIRDFVVVRINDEITVDLMVRTCGINYNEAEPDVDFRKVNEVRIPYANRRLMIKTKQGPREKDRIDLQYLLRIGWDENPQPPL
jgi:hypothetical protein